MRRKISLFINGKLADLDDQSLVLFNYTFEMLSSPTVVTNATSQQITLPGTPNNEAIFGKYSRLDRITGSGFNILVRTPFKIMNELNEVLVSGYLKLDSVASVGRKVYSYSVTLYGSLGGYFYGLVYKEDGTQMNLGDLEYEDANGDAFIPNESFLNVNAQTVNYCWLSIDDGQARTGNSWFNVLNFAPAYEGIPSDFDAKKALVYSNQFRDIVSKGSDDKTHPDAQGAYLVTMATDKTADEVRDIRAYLQRPVLSISAFLDALTARGHLTISTGAAAILRNDIWITLRMTPRADSYTNYRMKRLFDGSMTPADLLISLAKSFGLVFKTDIDDITLMTRDEFFAGGGQVDLTERIDVQSIGITPINFDAKWYLWQLENESEFAQTYKQEWGREYAEQRVNTGYDFNSSSKVVTDLKLKGAAQYLQRSLMNQVAYSALGTHFPAALFEKVYFTGYTEDGKTSKNIDVQPFLAEYATREYINTAHPLYDVFDKPQLYGSERKAVDGDGILLFYAGIKTLPNNSRMIWHITDDATSIFAAINSGIPCWDMRTIAGERIYKMPQFSRWNMSDGDNLDFGIASEVGVPGVAVPGKTLYAEYWSTYIRNLYDKDTSVLRCKVNLQGMNVGQNLLRNKYWYNNTWWRLNRIINHSMTTFDLTECEFVRMQDIAEQPAANNVILQDKTASINSGAITGNLFLKASGQWFIKSKPSWVSDIDPDGGAASDTWLEVEYDVAANTETTPRTGTIRFCLVSDESVYDEFTITQAGQTAPTGEIGMRVPDGFDNYETIDADTEYIYPELKASGAWTVTSNVAWLTPYSTGGWHGGQQEWNNVWCKVAANTGATRQGILTATLDGTDITATYTVTQNGSGSETTFLLSPSGSKRVDFDTVSQELLVTSNASWKLTAGNGVLLDGASSVTGTGNKVVLMTFGQNDTAAAKHNTVSGTTTSGTVKTVSLDVIQSPATEDDFLSAHPLTLAFAASPEGKSVTVSSNVRWTIESKPNWLTSDKPGMTGSGVVVFTASLNESSSSRTGSIVLSGDNVSDVTISVSQAGSTPQETISWQETSPIIMAKNETKELHVITDADHWTLSPTGNIDGNWYVSRNGNTVTVQKNTENDVTLELTAALQGGAEASMVINSKVVAAALTVGAWRDTPTSFINGSYELNNPDDEGYAISDITVAFLDANGNTLHTTTIALPSFINGNSRLSGTVVLATASVVAQHHLQNATDIRATVNVATVTRTAAASIGSTPPRTII